MTTWPRALALTPMPCPICRLPVDLLECTDEIPPQPLPTMLQQMLPLPDYRCPMCGAQIEPETEGEPVVAYRWRRRGV